MHDESSSHPHGGEFCCSEVENFVDSARFFAPLADDMTIVVITRAGSA